MTEKIIDLAEELIPIALIGPGGIGKTSVSLTVLHHDRIKKRFGDNRRFIRCDQFTASHTHFLNRLSKVIGAGVENPEDLTPLRPFLSSKEMILILDNAESILDPQGMNAEEIYSIVEELSQISNISLCITSRISTIPPTCKTLDIPVLSMEAACDTFYSIYQGGRQSNSVNSILEQLDFHPLSITLLATVAHHSKWNINRLAKEWEGQRIDMLHTQHNKSLATTIELSLASPMFQELGPDARELLGVIAFFPQGVNEDQLEWLFPTLSNRAKLFDNFCILSLTYQSNGFVTMLAPLRDYLYPKDPASSPLLCTTKNQYFSRLSVDVDPGQPGFEEAQWIISEDVNVEHLLDVFTSIDANSEETWNACIHFMRHLYWYKKRLVVLVPRIEGLSDEHNSKPKCLFWLSRLFDSVGNTLECKRLLIHALKLGREQEDPYQISGTLRLLGRTDRVLGLYKEGIAWVEESLEIYKGLDSTDGQAHSLQQLAWLLYYDKQLDAAAEATSQAINLSDAVYGQQFLACEHHRLLGNIYNSKGETEKAIEHFRTTLNILPPNWDDLLFLNHFSLAKLFFKENRPKDADTHIKLAKSHTSNSRLNLGCALELQAGLWYREHRFEEAKSEALHAIGVFENVGATKDVERCRATLQNIDVAIDPLAVSKKSDPNSEFLSWKQYYTFLMFHSQPKVLNHISKTNSGISFPMPSHLKGGPIPGHSPSQHLCPSHL